MSRAILLPLLVGAALAVAGPAVGQVASQGIEATDAETSDQPSADQATSIATSLGPAGDPGGYRAFLAARGVTYSLTYIGETLANVSGGQRRGAIGQGRVDAQLDIDLGTLAGWSGATLHANAFQIHGHGLSRYYLGNLLVVSGLEAVAATRLYELSFEQVLFDGRLAIRAGQLAADTEFAVSQYASLFVNSTFGWPAAFAADLPNGGPAYPLATPGLRVRWSVNDSVAVSVAAFDGAPAGRGSGDPQRNDRGGLEFRTTEPAFLIGEVALGSKPGTAGLPGVAKFGAWFHAARFDDLRDAREPDGSISRLADPAGSGVPRRLRRNGGVYAALDQLLYREEDGRDQGLGFFVRAALAPGDRNLVDLYVDGGLTYRGLIPGRPADTAGLGLAYAKISDAARGFDADLRFLGSAPDARVRSHEAVIEASYQAQIVPGWTVQPDIQYIMRPGGGVLNPRAPGRPERNAAVIGLRTAIRY